jgi:hypothetical protein
MGYSEIASCCGFPPSTKCQWWIEKPLKFMGRFGYGRKK